MSYLLVNPSKNMEVLKSSCSALTNRWARFLLYCCLILSFSNPQHSATTGVEGKTFLRKVNSKCSVKANSDSASCSNPNWAVTTRLLVGENDLRLLSFMDKTFSFFNFFTATGWTRSPKCQPKRQSWCCDETMKRLQFALNRPGWRSSDSGSATKSCRNGCSCCLMALCTTGKDPTGHFEEFLTESSSSQTPVYLYLPSTFSVGSVGFFNQINYNNKESESW